MKHYGDITKLNGHEVPLVDIVCGGSPCQDLSVAGMRKGLQHEAKGDGETTRSGLFMEQIRIVKEMRDESIRQLRLRGADDYSRLVRPKFLVWENVCGAFSSGTPKGADFRCVLEEVCRIADKAATIPMPEKGKWSTSGCIMGDGWSVAWRVHDAQFWGVPQRRKRISLVADFGGESAPEILFERKGLSRDFEESGKEGQGTSTDTERSVDKAIGVDAYNFKLTGETAVTLNATSCDSPSHSGPSVLQNHEISFQERAGKPGGGKGILIQNERTGALSTLNNQSVCYAIDQGGGKSQANVTEDMSPTLTTTHQGEPAICYGLCSMNSNSMKSSNPHSGIYEADTSRTLDLNGGNPACNQGGMMVVQGADMYNQSLTGEKTMSITGAATDSHHIPCVVYNGSNVTSPINASNPKIDDPCHTLTDDSRNYLVYCLQGNGIDRADTAGCNGKGWRENQSYTLNTIDRPAVYSIGHDERSAQFTTDEKTDPLTASDYKDPIKIADCRKTYQEKTGTLDCGMAKGTGNQLANQDMFVANQSVVRRLTPKECERLQNFPDDWTNIGEWTDTKGKKRQCTDGNRYKALGNSIALPYWSWMANRMVKVLKDDGVDNPTMASLFDGIGGFPLVYSRCDCEPIWASEIEEFPMAVTKIRFPEK